MHARTSIYTDSSDSMAISHPATLSRANALNEAHVHVACAHARQEHELTPHLHDAFRQSDNDFSSKQFGALVFAVADVVSEQFLGAAARCSRKMCALLIENASISQCNPFKLHRPGALLCHRPHVN